MKQSTSVESDLQNTLQSFLNQMPATNQTHTKKVRFETVNQQTGQPMKIEMEQTVVPAQTQAITANTNNEVALGSPSILALAVPGGALIEKLLGGHISYLIIPLAGMMIAWGYGSYGSGSASLSVASSLFLLSIVLELTAKFMSFPAVEALLNKRLSQSKVKARANTFVGQLWQDVAGAPRAESLKLMIQYAGIGLTFLACFILLGYFLQNLSIIANTSPVTAPYAVGSGVGAFEVR